MAHIIKPLIYSALQDLAPFSHACWSGHPSLLTVPQAAEASVPVSSVCSPPLSTHHLHTTVFNCPVY